MKGRLLGATTPPKKKDDKIANLECMIGKKEVEIAMPPTENVCLIGQTEQPTFV